MKRIVRNDRAEITLGQWITAVRSVEGLRLHDGRGLDGIAEVFDARFAEWTEAFVWREGTIHLKNVNAPSVDRVLEPLLVALNATVVEDE